MGIILKDWYGKDHEYDYDRIWIRDTEGGLVPFTKGTGSATLKPLEVTKNGNYMPQTEGVDGFSEVTVEVPAKEVILQDKEAKENGEYTADNGYDGLGKVTVNVPAPEIELQEITITENGEYTPDVQYGGFSKVTVNIDSAGGDLADICYVTFMSYDGLVEYGKKPVAVGDDCADPITRGIFGKPTRESTPQYDFKHDGWANEPNGAKDANWNKAIVEDKTVYATFKNVLRYYTITYLDEDGVKVLKTESLAYGSMPSYTPEKEGYALTGWQPAFATVVGDASYTSVWKVDNILGEGTFDDGLRWTLYKSGDLYIDGEGDMTVRSESQMPWYSIRESIIKVVVADGITSLSSNAFCRCTNLKTCTLSANMTELPLGLFQQTIIEDIVIPANVAKISKNVFSMCNALKTVTFEASSSKWQVSTYGYNQGGTNVYVSNPTTNATNLKSTHLGKYWTKVS